MTNLGSIRGLEDTHQLEIAVDGERVLLAPVGSEQEYTDAVKNATDIVNLLEARLQARVFVKRGRAAGGRGVPGQDGDARRHAGCRTFERSTLIATDHRGVPHVESVTIYRAVQSQGARRHGEPPPRLHLPSAAARGAGSSARPTRRRLRADDRLAPGAARLPPPGHRGGPRAADEVLRRRPPRGGLRARHRDGAARHPRQPEVPDPRRARARRRGGWARCPASATSTWRRGSRSSCGAAFPTTS